MTLNLNRSDTESRNDLVAESLQILGGSGEFTSKWYDSSDVDKARFAVKFLSGSSPTFAVEEAQWDTSNDPRVIRTQSISISSLLGYAELSLTCRWFRIVIGSGDASGYCAFTIRRV
jgi:hypothetical protein